MSDLARNDDGLDLRKFGTLKPTEQLDVLERDFRRLMSTERGMRAAEAELQATQTKEVKP